MLLHLLGVSSARASTPFPFPSLHSLKLNPPLTPSHLTLLPPSPPNFFTSITAAAAATPPTPQYKDFMVDLLVDTLDFSRNEAISVSAQVNHTLSIIKPNLVINLFLQYGLTKTQVQKIVSTSPFILRYKAYDYLEPRLKYFLKELGLSGSGFVKLIEKCPKILFRGLDSCIIPTVNYLKQELSDDEHVMDLLGVIESPVKLERLQLNVALLRNYGFANEVIRKFVIENTIILLNDHEMFKDRLSRVDREVGLPRDSPMSLQNIFDLGSVRKSNLQIEMFKEFGWTDLDIANVRRREPSCLKMSEDKLRKALTFYMKEVGCTPEYLASRAKLLKLNLEKRVKPRYEVYKILIEKKLISYKAGLFWLLTGSESVFLERYVLRYKDELPNLYEIYRNSMKDLSKD